MPKYAHHTFENGGVAIWHITETADELYTLLDTDKYDCQLVEKHNEARRAEWLAVRLLVKELFGADCEVAYHHTGRPYLKDSAVRISISHTRGFAAVAYHHSHLIGVDIEYLSSRVERVAYRFTSHEETAYLESKEAGEQLMYHLVNWSAKETLYKLFDSSSMADFKAAFSIAPYELSQSGALSVSVLGSPNCAAPDGAPEVMADAMPDVVLDTALNAMPDAARCSIAVFYHIYPEFVCTWAIGG